MELVKTVYVLRCGLHRKPGLVRHRAAAGAAAARVFATDPQVVAALFVPVRARGRVQA
jgi:hypothetical protein